MSADLNGPVDARQIEDFSQLLRHTWKTLARSKAQRMGRESLGNQAYWVLSSIAEAPRKMADLAEAAESSSASLTGIVDRLEERGLVSRCRSSEDRRVVWVGITDAGREHVDAVTSHVRTRIGTLLEPLTYEERAELVRLLSKMNER